jgi:ABC-type molybdenum transport system ATPase subunit/photorepair protein PhrA
MSSPKPHCLQPFLSLRDGAFRLGDRIVFEHTTWVFQRHEQWAIIGANGSGKSLLADAVRGRLPLVKRLFSTLAGLKAGRGSNCSHSRISRSTPSLPACSGWFCSRGRWSSIPVC